VIRADEGLRLRVPKEVESPGGGVAEEVGEEAPVEGEGPFGAEDGGEGAEGGEAGGGGLEAGFEDVEGVDYERRED
jgi:hypothetical protein